MFSFASVVRDIFSKLKKKTCLSETSTVISHNTDRQNTSCSLCKTGKESYALDSKSVCPHIGSIVDGKCGHFESLED